MPDKPTAAADLSTAPVQDQPTPKAAAIPTREEREELRRIYEAIPGEMSEDVLNGLDAIDILEQRLAAAEADTARLDWGIRIIVDGVVSERIIDCYSEFEARDWSTRFPQSYALVNRRSAGEWLDAARKEGKL